jgi:hypothetical protein
MGEKRDVMQKTRRLTQEQHKRRLSYGVCPRCGDFRLVRVVRYTEGERPGSPPKFAGAFWACGGPSGHECYHLSGETGTVLAESSEDVPEMQDDVPFSEKPPRLIRRKKT